MHELFVCAEPNCRHYNVEYKEAMIWANTQPKMDKLLVSPNGLRLCNGCNNENAWSYRSCPNCETPFGMRAKNNHVQNPPEIILHICEVCDHENVSGPQCLHCTAYLPGFGPNQ